MSQDPQGRSPGSLEWEAMGGDPFPDTSQELEKTGQRDRGAEGKGEEDENSQRQRGKTTFTRSSLFGEKL